MRVTPGMTSNNKQDNIRERRVTDEVDFIVVGGGSGGATVAGRLSENPATSVALLDADPNRLASFKPHNVPRKAYDANVHLPASGE